MSGWVTKDALVGPGLTQPLVCSQPLLPSLPPTATFQNAFPSHSTMSGIQLKGQASQIALAPHQQAPAPEVWPRSLGSSIVPCGEAESALPDSGTWGKWLRLGSNEQIPLERVYVGINDNSKCLSKAHGAP